MTVRALSVPQFYKDQSVGFLGGAGIIKTYQHESGAWNYLVEMELGPDLGIGRIGSETRVWITESDLFPV